MKKCTHTLFATAAMLLAPWLAQGEASNPAPAGKTKAAEPVMEEVYIFGQQEATHQATGAVHYLGQKELQRFIDSDIQKMVRALPGVSVQVEDGYGLRPNLGIRGVATERSSRIVLLEDNLPIAPAPYAASSAYYFPTPGRMAAVELVKGPAAISQGPYTVGGALNFISTPIVAQGRSRQLLLDATETGQRLHGYWSQRFEQGFGFMAEVHDWRDDGFQNIDRSSRHPGLEVRDYTLKLGYAKPGSPHRFEFKMQRADQESNQSYLGLTDADFHARPLRRYGLSARDNIETSHDQLAVRYQYQISDSSRLSLAAYDNQFQRNWYKTEGIDLDGSGATDADALGGYTRWSSVIQAINTNTALAAGGTMFTPATLLGLLHGKDTPDGVNIALRANNREYFSRGIQGNWQQRFQLGNSEHQLEVGARYHEDEEDRLQHEDAYRQSNGSLQQVSSGSAGTVGNRVQSAQAYSVHLYDRISLGNWQLAPGLRYEHIDQQRQRYRDGRARSPRDQRSNQYSVWLPGLGLTYSFNEQLSLVAGAHRGFSAAGNSPNADPEEAINYELGLRYKAGSHSWEAISFLTDYDNLLGECTASSGAECTVGDAFNGDAATVRGLEVSASSERQLGKWNLYGQLSYTFTDAQFDSDIADTDFFGDVSRGDPLPYLPEHQGQLSLGLMTGNWDLNLRLKYVAAVCVRASCNAFERTDSSATADLAVQYAFREGITLIAKVDNLTDSIDLLGRHPYGARPGQGRTASLALRLAF